MRFNVLTYLDGIEQALEQVPRNSRTAFAVWCAEALWRSARSYIASKINPSEYLALSDALKYLWDSAAGVHVAHPSSDQILQNCEEISWSEDDVNEDDQTMNFIAVEAVNAILHALESCASSSSVSAAKCAECVINTLDRQLSDELFVDSNTEVVYTHPTMLAELDRQGKMLEHLRNSLGLSHEQSHLFRK